MTFFSKCISKLQETVRLINNTDMIFLALKILAGLVMLKQVSILQMV